METKQVDIREEVLDGWWDVIGIYLTEYVLQVIINLWYIGVD